MDVFSGTRGVSKAVRRLGYMAKFWDIEHRPSHDLTNKQVVNRILSEIRKGCVMACMLGPVCTSFSVARDRTKVIRNRRFPWGVPKRFMTKRRSTGKLA